MATYSDILRDAVEEYFADLGRIARSGGATVELSSHFPLNNLLKAIGATLKPKVFCVGELADHGAGHPDLGLYTVRQVTRGRPREGQLPERGVVEVKSSGEDAWVTADSDQVSRYWNRYRLVLVTNSHDFVLVGEDAAGRPTKLETFRLALTPEEFSSRLERPRAYARDVGVSFGEYLVRALSQTARLAEPKDLAWLLASYARDALARVEGAGDNSSLEVVRSALEESLGVRFEAGKGEAFFRSTLVQTLFYGVFSAWVLWSLQTPRPAGSFNWREAVWHLRVPVIQALYQQVSDPSRLQQLDLVEVLDWASSALDRVDREAFFNRFDEGQAVPYFYEPFLEAFDPKLRKQLGVWYTPPEVVRYMVARVDRALKDDLDIEDGLAAPNVYVLDPCCGTGAFLTEVLRRIASNLQGRGLGALIGATVKQAALTRIFGFDIMPAPFVVAHLQIGLALRQMDAALAEDGTERAGVFLTNALTGWASDEQDRGRQPFPELDEERGRAERVKQDKPILVVLGNPPYNGFAGMAVGEEERALSNAYRSTVSVRPPEGQGLNDLYVRFFRVAERRIVEQSGQGVVCYISNFSWLDGLSFTGMRERYLAAFGVIRIDCLNGDKYRTGKRTPDGLPDPSIFSTQGNPNGIQVGTAIATLVRTADHIPSPTIGFRHLWGKDKDSLLLKSADGDPNELYDELLPVQSLGLPFKPLAVSEAWHEWPSISDLFRERFPGVKTSRDRFLVDIDLDKLRERLRTYLDPELSNEDISQLYPRVMHTVSGIDGNNLRSALLNSDSALADTHFVRYSYRPYDDRWLYWDGTTRLLDRPRPDYQRHVFEKNRWLISQQKPRRGWSPPQVISHLGCLDLIDRGATCIPAWLSNDGLEIDGEGGRIPNLSPAAETYLNNLGMDVDDLFHHVVAVLHDPAYQKANAGALRMDWPRIPLPGWPTGRVEGAGEELAASAEHGRDLAALLDSDSEVVGVTTGQIRDELAVVAVPSTVSGGSMTGDDFALAAGWGHFGPAKAVMPGVGRAVERTYTTEERDHLGSAVGTLGGTTFDIHLNDTAYLCNVPSAVWNYKLGGYQVLKKWLSYRERRVLDRPLKSAEVAHLMNTARRIAAILLLTNH